MMIAAVTNDESLDLDKLRAKVDGLDNFSDGTLLRWLRGNYNSVEATLPVLKKHLVFRKAWGVDELLTKWKRPEVLEKYLSYGLCGPDKDGSPVLLSFFGSMDVEGVLKSVESQDYIKFSLMIVEEGVQKCEEYAEMNGIPFDQIMLVFDMENMTSAHYSFKTFAASFLNLLAIYQENYPMLMKKILVIKAPSMARYVYKVLTPFLSESTQELIQFPGDDWLDVVFEYVEPSRWPKCLGGELTDEDGDPNCPSQLHIGLGAVPATYFVDLNKVMPQCDQETTVYPGNKHTIEFSVRRPGSRLCWKYMVREEDIGFAVIRYDANSSSGDLVAAAARGDEDTTTDGRQTIFPYVRLECSVVPASGAITCEFAGKYVIEFDNQYSWFSAKELRYWVALYEP